MKTLCTLIATALLVTTANARIGETEKEIAARYGRVLQSSEERGEMPLRLYQSAGMQIGVVFLNGKSVAEFISRTDKKDLSGTAVQLLLTANADGTQWEEKMPFANGRGMWRIESKGITAIYGDAQLVISTDEFTKVSNEQIARKEKEKLKGF